MVGLGKTTSKEFLDRLIAEAKRVRDYEPPDKPVILGRIDEMLARIKKEQE